MEKKSNYIVSLHPLTTIWLIPVTILTVMLFYSYLVNFIILGVLIAISIAAGKGKEFILLSAKSIFILAFSIFLMQFLFFPHGNEVFWKWGAISLTKGGMVNALNMSTNILAMAAAFLLYFRLCTERQFVVALQDSGVNFKACFTILATLQMIPQMGQYSMTIMDAQKTRGIEVEGNLSTRMKAFIPSLGPLILASIAATEERAITVETRGFSVECKKTNLHHSFSTKRDKYIKIGLLVLTIAIIVAKVVL